MSSLPVPSVPNTDVAAHPSMRLDRKLTRALQRLEGATILKIADVRAESLVQAQRLHEVDHLVQTAMSGQAMLHRWSATLSQGDPFVADDLRFFTDIARLGKGEIIASAITSFTQEDNR